MGKILDITERIKKKKYHEDLTSPNKGSILNLELTNITEARKETINRERRELKRTILTEFIGAFIVLPERGLFKVSIYDISENGLSFDLDANQGKFENGDEVAMRVYMSKTTYFPFFVQISNGRMIENESIIRHGALFSKGTVNDIALNHFVKFIETVSVTLRKDNGDITVSNIS